MEFLVHFSGFRGLRAAALQVSRGPYAQKCPELSLYNFMSKEPQPYYACKMTMPRPASFDSFWTVLCVKSHDPVLPTNWPCRGPCLWKCNFGLFLVF